ncbi:MAG: DNA repair protein RecN [Bdellovibrionia bacterium]
MLEVLRIKNIAIIHTAEIQFKKGLNILTGETGAGKSIVLEAISLLLGSRARTELIRAECAEATVEGLFCVSEIPWIENRLEHYGISKNDHELLIKRIVHRGGRHRIYINGELSTLSVLQNLCEGLIDLCGQHEHQSLLRSSTQLELLDRYGNLTDQSRAVSQLLEQYHQLHQESSELTQQEQERKKRIDFLKFQIREIQEAELKPNEEESLHQEKTLLLSAENRAQLAEQARQWLESDESGAITALKASVQKLKALSHLDENSKPIQATLEAALFEAEEGALKLNRYLEGIDLNAERLQIVQERISSLTTLKRKYGSSVAQILQTADELQTELETLDQAHDRLAQLDGELLDLREKLTHSARLLTQARKKKIPRLEKSVTSELQDLRMSEARFLVDLQPKGEISEWGSSADQIHFMIQTNPGEPAKPLGKIASGGELSRLMLAVRRVIANRGGIGVYLFDEIDAGIGGQTAFEVGKKLKSVASYNQVICITHLPQVASFADHHWVVRKSVVESRTLTLIQELTDQERRMELARMLGGSRLTQKSLENASELMDHAKPL